MIIAVALDEDDAQVVALPEVGDALMNVLWVEEVVPNAA